MGFLKNLREKYFGTPKKAKVKKKAVLKLSGQVPRSMRRDCLKNLPFSNEEKQKIRVYSIGNC